MTVETRSGTTRRHPAGRSHLGGWIAVAVLGVVGAGLTSTGVFASWVTSTTATTGTQAAANLAMVHEDVNNTTFTSGAANLLPGDYLYRYANLTNDSDLAQDFSALIEGTGALTATNGLRVAVDACSQAWAANGSCGGSLTPVVTERDIAGAGTQPLGQIAAHGVTRLRYKFVLSPTADQATFQGKSGTVKVTINGASAVAGNRDRTAG